MRKENLILLLFNLFFFTTGHAQLSKTLNIIAGNLSTSFTTAETKTTTDIKITGTLNAADLYFIRDSLLIIQSVDLTEARIINPLDTIPDRAFFKKTTLKKFISPDNLKYIGESAFFGCKALTDIQVPQTISELGSSAFADCGITSIELPASITKIGGACFWGCKNLEKATIPYSENEGSLFSGCYNLTTIIVPEGVTEVRNSAFYQLISLKNITLPHTITSIGTHAFYNCGNLDSITIPEGVTSIGDGAFWQCMRMKSIKLPNSLTKIGADAFSSCSSLTSVIIPKGVTFIDRSIFGGCSELVTLTIPYGTDNVNGFSLFDTCSKLRTIIIPDGVTSIKNFAFSSSSTYVTEIRIPSSVKSIGERAFSGCSGILSLLIPDSVTTIGAYAFSNCSKIETLSIPESVTQIGAYVFSGCTGLKSIILPKTLARLNIYSFQNCSNLNSITLPASLTSIDEGVFSGCSKLTSITFPASVVSLAKYAFSGCQSLDLSSIPESVTSIGESCFSGCKGLTSITIPSNTTINYNAFQNCTGLVVATTPYAYNSGDIFNGCTSLKTIIIPSGMTSIRNNAFYNCNLFDSINFPSTVRSIGSNAFYNCSKLKTLNLPANLMLINEYAFANCAGLVSVNIPESIYAIPNACFYKCTGLRNLNIPQSIRTISSNAFWGCTGLNSITINNSFPIDLTQSNSVFSNVNKTSCQLKVPYGTATRYAAANQWGEFKNIIENATGIYVNSNIVELSANPGSSANINVKANIAWTSFASHTWLKVDPVAGSGDMILSVTSDSTQIESNRKAIITISAPNCTPQYIEVTQKLAPKSIEITAGRLSSVLTSNELKSLSKLTITGTIDARDIKTIRDNMPALTELDLSQTSIVAYSGTEGTFSYLNTYPENDFPQYAFYDSYTGISKTSLKTVKLPSTITVIDNYAFAGCSGLTSISIPVKVNKIGKYAFYNCINLSSIVVNSVYPIDLKSSSYVFYNIKTNCLLTVPYGSKALYAEATQWNAFTNIIEKSKGVFPGTNMVELSYEAGSNITIDIKANVVWSVSSDQTWLNVAPPTGNMDGQITLTAEANQSSVVRKAFVTISSDSIAPQIIEVTQYIAPKNINIEAGGLRSALTVDEKNFLSTLIITGTIDARDFKIMRDSMPYITDLDISGASIRAYTGKAGTNLYDSTYVSNRIPDFAFYNYEKGIGKARLKAIVLPATIEAIGDYAFGNCSELTSFTIPAMVSSLGIQVFYNCKNLTSVFANSSYPLNLSIGSNPFYYVNKDSCVLYVPYKAKAQYSSANQWSSFKNIVEAEQGFIISEDKIKLSYETNGPDTLQISANVGWTVTTDQPWISVSQASGSGDSRLIVTIEKNDSTSWRYARLMVSSPGFDFQVVYITQTGSPKKTNIEAGKLFTTLTLDELNTTSDLVITGSIDARDFKTLRDKMPELVNLDISDVTINAYEGTDGTWEYNSVYPANTIPENAFNNSETNIAKISLKSIKLPSNIVSIRYSAFRGCTGLISFTIPYSVTSLGYYAFQGCNNITSIYTSSVYPIDLTNSGGVFDGVNKTNCTLHVPYGAKELYVVANQWKDFVNIVESDTGFIVVSNNIKLRSNEGSSAQISIKSNIEWTASCDQSWLKILPISGKGNDSALISAEANPFSIIRNAIVTISAPGEKSQLISVMQAGATKTINNTAGQLSTIINSEDIKNVSELIITGTIDASDFYFMRDSLPMLTFLDISQTKIVAYLGNFFTGYAANIIPWNAFYNPNTSKGKTSLVSIILPSTSTNIFESAFQSCTGLTDIIIPSSVIKISKNAFNSCTSLMNIQLPDSILTLEELSFANCTNLKTFTIPPFVTYIGVNAFMNCTGLKTINSKPDIPVNISYNWGVFYNVDKTNCVLYVPYGKKSLYIVADQWKDFTNIIENSNGVLLNKSSIELPNKDTGDVTVNVISDGAWSVSCDQDWLDVSPENSSGNNVITLKAQDNSGIYIRKAIVTVTSYGAPSKRIVVTQAASPKVITIDAGGLYDSLTEEERNLVSNLVIKGKIDARDFKTMRDAMPILSILNLAETVISAYNGNQGPESYGTIIKNSIYPANEIPNNAFFIDDFHVFKESLKKVTLPPTITKIGLNAFKRCSALDSISIPNSVNTISGMAFKQCTGLKSINFSNSLKYIDYDAFAFCSSLTRIILPNSLISIGISAFESCINIEKITFSSSLNSILSGAFRYCTKLKRIELPNSLILLDQYTFNYCTSLDEVSFGNSLTTIGFRSFEGCAAIKSIDIPNTVTIIDGNAFSNCKNLSTVKLSNLLNKLGSGVFEYCTALTNISIPATVVSMGAGIFDYSGIKTIYSYPVNPVLAMPYNEMFGEFDKLNCLLYVPVGSKSAYQTAYEWKDFIHIIEMPTAVPALTDERVCVYPNPFSESFKIKGIEGTCHVSISDVNGKILLNQQINNEDNIELSHLAKGLYFVRISTKDGMIIQTALKN